MTTESPRWFKSSYSGNGGQCIEVAHNFASSSGVVPVRDSKDPQGPALTFSTSAWGEFVDAVQRGELPTV